MPLIFCQFINFLIDLYLKRPHLFERPHPLPGLTTPNYLATGSMSLSQYTEIVALQRRAGSCVAFLIGLGEKFFSSGVTEVDRDLIPTILSRVPSNVTSRVIPSLCNATLVHIGGK